ncbi:DUF481 domain-containing protein [Psychromonas sp. Urea-02u-13]|uniref:DUF481 domain-containing protein n=1 Tax=Psychromonas sp. Urea-02u-13 TaxID=2058326 RepID=UPI000C347DCF|nr:DUF481 domain-containing protein [Psychromonas sp. Urea-02u-13]PKG39485.1 hypothetical protein CXF74_07945 [Psychromonas sp. Urea-02u-13]
MGSRWFYILLANVAVLTANVWLFVDKPLPDATESAAPSHPSFIVLENVEGVKSKSNKAGIASMNGFHFLLNDPLAPEPEDLQPQLSLAKKTIEQKNSQINKARQKNKRQSAQVTQQKNKNKKLQRQLFTLQDTLRDREEVLVSHQRKIEQLEEQTKIAENNRFKTDIDLVKKSIEYQPDLVNVKSAEKSSLQSTAIGKESLTDEIESKRFSGSVEFGFTYEQDNQVTKAVNGRLILDYDEPDKYNINSDLDFEFEDEDGETSTEKYRWQLQSDYNLDPHNLMFARSDVNRSQFSSYEQEDIFTVGYGRIFFSNEKHKFNAEVGPGYRFAVPNVGEDAVSIDEFIVRTRLNYERIITDSLQVKVDTVLEAGHSNSVYSLSFKAQNRIYQELYLTFSFDYKFTENVPVDTVNKEVSSGLSLLYAF